MQNFDTQLAAAEQIARVSYWKRLIAHVEGIYNNSAIIEAYAKQRSEYQTTKLQHTYGRSLWSAPDNYVYFFLQQYFEPKYGSKWTFRKEVLRHELVQPWLLVPLAKI